MCRRERVAEVVDGEEQREKLAERHEQRDSERRALGLQHEHRVDAEEVGDRREHHVRPETRQREMQQRVQHRAQRDRRERVDERRSRRVRVRREARERQWLYKRI